MKKLKKYLKPIQLTATLAILVVWASCMPKANQDYVTVNLSLPSSGTMQKSESAGILSSCFLSPSYVVAHNTVTDDLSYAVVAAEANPALFGGIGSGQSVLTFDTQNVSMNLASGAGWNFYYLGSFGLTACTAGNTIVSYGQVSGQELTEDKSIALDVVTAANHIQQGGATAPTDFANVTFDWQGSGSTACSSDGTVQLKLVDLPGKPNLTVATIPYSVTGTYASTSMTVGPVPKFLNYQAIVTQANPTSATYTFNFKSDENGSALNVVVPTAAAGLCRSGPGVTVPNAPSSFTALAASSSSIQLNWTDNSTNESGFVIQRSSTGTSGTYTVINATSADVVSYLDTGLSVSSTYYYKVNSFNSAGGSSNVAANATLDTPNPPSSLAASAISSSTIQVTWLDVAADETGYQVHRSLDNITFSSVSSTAANTTIFTDTGLVSGTTYYYKVRGVNAVGNGIFTSAVSSTTLSGGAGTPPLAPSVLVIPPGMLPGDPANLSWNDNSADETGFEIQRSTNDNTHFAFLDTTPADTAVYSDFTAISGTDYYYRVRAYKTGSVSSTYTNEVLFSAP